MKHAFRFTDSDLEIVSDNILEGSPEERLLIILKTEGKCTKIRLCKLMRFEGPHEEFERQLSMNEINSLSTSMRKMQQITRNLRELKVPIVSDRTGSWIATTLKEVQEYIEWLTHKAEADIKSMLHVRNQLATMINESPKLLI